MTLMGLKEGVYSDGWPALVLSCLFCIWSSCEKEEEVL